MDKRVLVFLGIVLLGAGVLFLSRFRFGEQLEIGETKRAQETRPATLSPQNDTRGGVTVSVQPSRLGEEWRFELILDTHEGTLDADLGTATLRVGEVEYLPHTVAGDPPEGHHRRAVLMFSVPSQQITEAVTLTVYGVGEVNERIFTWLIEK